MILDQNEHTTIITQEKASVVEIAKKIQTLYPKFKNNHVVVVLTTSKTISLEDINYFLEISNTHRASKQSFVIVSQNIDLQIVPKQIIVVPTIQEAYDIIEMEEIERDLGF